MEKTDNVVSLAGRRGQSYIEKMAGALTELGLPEDFVNAYREAIKGQMATVESEDDLGFEQRIDRVGHGGICIFNRHSEGGLQSAIHIAPMDMGRGALCTGLPSIDFDSPQTRKKFWDEWTGRVFEPATVKGRLLVPAAALFAAHMVGNLIGHIDDIIAYDDKDMAHHVAMVLDGAEYANYVMVMITIFKRPILAEKERIITHHRSKMPGYAPMWKDVEDGTLKATMTFTRPKSAFFKGQPPAVMDEIIGRLEDRPAMEKHIQAMEYWRWHYDIYYSCTDYEYETKWKEIKPKKKKVD